MNDERPSLPPNRLWQPTTAKWFAVVFGAALVYGTQGEVKMRTFGLRLFIVALATVVSAPALAQTESSGGKLVSKADKSGTNPINFTNDLRAYYEYQDLSNGGEGHVGTLEGRTPVLDGKVQIRVRVPFKALDFDVGGTNISESGLGDINARLLTVPYLDPKNGLALAVGLEMFFPTAGDDVLGEGKFSLGPQIFGVKFAPFGIKGSLIAPAVQQVFSVAGESDRRDVNRTQFDLFILKQSDDKRKYVLLDPAFPKWTPDLMTRVRDSDIRIIALLADLGC